MTDSPGPDDSVQPDDDWTDVPWLSIEEQRAWRSVLEGTIRLNEALHRDLEQECGLSLSEYDVLVRLSEAPERTLRMSVLAEGLAQSRSRLTHTVHRMSNRGLVERVACRMDGRGVNCVLTDAGFALLEKSAPAHVRSVRRHLVDCLAADEFLAFGVAFDKVTQACRTGDE